MSNAAKTQTPEWLSRQIFHLVTPISAAFEAARREGGLMAQGLATPSGLSVPDEVLARAFEEVSLPRISGLELEVVKLWLERYAETLAGPREAARASAKAAYEAEVEAHRQQQAKEAAARLEGEILRGDAWAKREAARKESEKSYWADYEKQQAAYAEYKKGQKARASS